MGRWKWKRILLWGSLVLALLLGSAYYVILSMPGHSYVGTLPPLSADELPVRDHLTQHVQALAGKIGERHIWRPAALDQAVRYIEATWHGQGYTVARQPFEVEGQTVYNLAVEFPGGSRRDEIVLVGAHYDTVPGSPGANDNATGTAAVLELARLLVGQQLPRTVRFVAFVNEEAPFFQHDTMGSWVYARQSRARPCSAMRRTTPVRTRQTRSTMTAWRVSWSDWHMWSPHWLGALNLKAISGKEFTSSGW